MEKEMERQIKGEKREERGDRNKRNRMKKGNLLSVGYRLLFLNFAKYHCNYDFSFNPL